MTQLEALTDLCLRFRRERNWEQFHNPKDHAVSLCLEAAEILEHFQWKNGPALDRYLEEKGKAELKKELADVLIYLLFMAYDLGIDLEEAVREKMAENARKYPVEKAYGSAAKYDEL